MTKYLLHQSETEKIVKHLFVLLIGRCPLLDISYATIPRDQIIDSILQLKEEKWSDEFKEFVSLCLRIDPDERPTVDELLDHKWIYDLDTSFSSYQRFINVASQALPLMEKRVCTQ